MNTRRVLAALLSVSFLASLALAQGLLTPPPGAPAPTMKTLDQLEPRTPLGTPGQAITSTVYIMAPGSYVLMAPVTMASGNGIVVMSSNVTLDLNGFTISSAANPSTDTGIFLNGANSQIVVRNGHIRGGVTYNGSVFTTGPGFMYGIYNQGTQRNVTVTDVTVSGVASHGIALGTHNTVVRNCTVDVVGGTGITATQIYDSSTAVCGNGGIEALQTVQNCTGIGIAGSGISATCIENSVGMSNSSRGIDAGTAVNSLGSSVSNIGLLAQNAGNCSGFTTSGLYGLYAYRSANSSSGMCTQSDSTATGLFAETAQNCCGYAAGSGNGLDAWRSAAGSFGSSDSGTGLVVDDGDALNCRGDSSSGYGLQAGNATNCIGTTITGLRGLSVDFTATGSVGKCTGTSASGTGLYAGSSVLNCYGSAAGGGSGIYAVNNAENSTGVSVSGIGLGNSNTGSALNCRGTSASGFGLNTGVAINCTGSSSGFTGLLAYRAASNCYGSTSSTTGGSGLYVQQGSASHCVGYNANGTALYAAIAVACTAPAGTITATNKYLMP